MRKSFALRCIGDLSAGHPPNFRKMEEIYPIGLSGDPQNVAAQTGDIGDDARDVSVQ